MAPSSVLTHPLGFAPRPRFPLCLKIQAPLLTETKMREEYEVINLAGCFQKGCGTP